MAKPCPYTCFNKNSAGYCQSTCCVKHFTGGYQPKGDSTPPAPPTTGSNAVKPQKQIDKLNNLMDNIRRSAANGFESNIEVIKRKDGVYDCYRNGEWFQSWGSPDNVISSLAEIFRFQIKFEDIGE